MEVTEAQIDNIATLNEANSTAAAPVADTVLPVADNADPYIAQFKKEVRKKEIQTDDVEFLNAKAYLSTKINGDSASVYDHLANLVSRLLETKPTNALGKSTSSKIRKH